MTKRSAVRWTAALALPATVLACGRNGGDPPTTRADGAEATPSHVAAERRPLWAPTTHPDALDVGDLLEIRVSGLDLKDVGPGQFVRVQSDGTAVVPYLGSVGVADRSAAEAARQIRELYRINAILNDAVVSVRRVQVAGAGGVAPGPIGKYDLVRCAISDLPTPVIVVARVNGRGEFPIPYVGQVRFSGLTDAQVTVAVHDALRAAQVMMDARVSVLTLERAPADAEHKSLPDGPIEPVPEALRLLYAVN